MEMSRERIKYLYGDCSNWFYVGFKMMKVSLEKIVKKPWKVFCLFYRQDKLMAMSHLENLLSIYENMK